MPIDKELIEEARKIGGHKTKKAAIPAALLECVAGPNRLKIISAFGTIDFDPSYDYKSERKSKR